MTDRAVFLVIINPKIIEPQLLNPRVFWIHNLTGITPNRNALVPWMPCHPPESCLRVFYVQPCALYYPVPRTNTKTPMDQCLPENQIKVDNHKGFAAAGLALAGWLCLIGSSLTWLVISSEHDRSRSNFFPFPHLLFCWGTLLRTCVR